MACSSCGSNLTACGCGIDTLMMPVAKGDKGDTGSVGLTGPQGLQGIGSLNSIKRLYYKLTYPGSLILTIPLADFTSANLSIYAYNGDTGLFETNIFADVGMFMASLRLYAVSAGVVGGTWWDLTNRIEAAEVAYTATDIILNIGNNVFNRALQLCGDPVDFYVVIQG